MFRRSRYWVPSIALLLIAAGALHAERPFRQPVAREEPLNLSGTVVAAQAGMIQVASATGETWYLRTDPQRTKIQVTGTAEPEFLQPGLFVRFTGVLTKRGQCQDPVGELTICTPSKDSPVGVYPESGMGPAEEKSAKKPARPAAGASSVVVGQIRSVKLGKLVVAAGGTSVKADLADGAKIAVDSADVSLARKGDKIEATGVAFRRPQAGQPGAALVQSVKITLAEPLAGTKKGKKPVRTLPPRSAKPKKPGEEPAGTDQPAGKAAADQPGFGFDEPAKTPAAEGKKAAKKPSGKAATEPE
jgi:hypothetical protein